MANSNKSKKKSIEELTFRQFWRDALRTIVGPRNFGTKGLLLTMDLWMNEYGLCYPSYTQLMNASSLSRPTVNKHIDLAEEDRWILKQQKAAKNGRYLHNVYQAIIPFDAVKKFNHVKPENISTQLKFLHDEVKILNSNPSREPEYSFFPENIDGKIILKPNLAFKPNQSSENEPLAHGKKSDSKKRQSQTKPPSGRDQPPNPQKNLFLKEQKNCIEYLNHKAGKNFPTDRNHPSLIKIFNSGWTVEHVKQAIDNAVEAYNKDELNEQYLSPKGLFNPTWFEHWLNAKAKTKKKKNPNAGIVPPKSQEEIMNAV